MATFQYKTSRPLKFTEDVQAQFLQLLANGTGKMEAAQICDVSYRCVQNHYKQHPEFLEQMKEALLFSVERVEGALFSTAMGGNVNAQKFYLTNRAPKRWQEKSTITNKVQGMTDEELINAARSHFGGVNEPGVDADTESDTDQDPDEEFDGLL